ncbi:MAG: GEVED domain-containing protein, partial [Bacteroidota bacterium]
LSYQWQSSPDNVNFTNILGATNASHSTLQTVTTYYRCIVTCNAGSTATSTSVQVNMNPFFNCYCTPTNSGTSCLTNVNINTLNNTTAGCSGGTNYSQQTATTTLSLGVSYNITITCDAAAITSVWFDWNQNGSYEVSEWVQPYINATTGSVQVTVPVNAVQGNTGMRVRSRAVGNINGAIDACTAFGSGETEDYVINIGPLPTCPQPTNFGVIQSDLNSVQIDWVPGGSETTWQIQYGTQGFALGTGTIVTTTSNPYTISGLNSYSFYQAYVRAICGPGDTSFWTPVISWNTYNQGQFLEWDNQCPTSGFINISSTGTNLNLTDDTEASVTLPFPVLYQGNLYTLITVGNNGGIVFGTGAAQVGYTMAAGNGLYPYVQDLNTALPGGGVYHGVVGTAPNRKFIVSWNDLPHFGTGGTDGSTFQLIIEEATMAIYFVYQDVAMSNVLWNNGTDAEIGVRGPQNINVSLNNATYLSTNSCVHFNYTNCPKPTNLTLSNLLPTEATLTWTPSPANENSWTVIYGPDGFDPTTSGTSQVVTSPTALITGLTQLTGYDVYIYSECGAGLVSNGLFGNVFTPPYCSNPTAMNNSTDIDSIFTTWVWQASSTNYPSTSFNIQYGPLGFELYSEGTIVPVDNNLTDSIINSSLLSGGVYSVYVQAVCASDTSQFIGPFNVTMPLTNDSICDAETIPVNGVAYAFNNTGATVEAIDVDVAPPATGANTTTGWVNNFMNNTTWFKFIAPPSGDIRINSTAINFNGQIAVYSPNSCTSIIANDLEGANDDAIGSTSVAPNFTICNLVPGQEYYLLHDGFAAPGIYSISISEIILNAGTTNGIVNVCYGDTANLFDGLSNYQPGGTWTQQIPTLGLQDSLFTTLGLASSIYPFTYTLTNGCATDNEVIQLEIYSPSTAGNDGSISVCLNEPFNLLSGLEGNVDFGGTWFNPQNIPLSNSLDTASAVGGQFNYDYIVSNGVCPADTANILVVVDPSCDYLASIDELNSSILIYPNPTSTSLTIDFVKTNVAIDFAIFDIQGKAVYSEKNISLVNGKHQINTSSLVPGVYMLHINSFDKQYIYRIIKD